MTRIDVYLHQKGFCQSRSSGARLVTGGYILVDGIRVEKPSFEVSDENEITVCENPILRYVSRGGLKLERALEVFGVNPDGKICADIGSSTGGFTDCLLQHGAKKVYAIDSGTEQLHPSLRENVCVVPMENTNARFLDESMIEKVDLVVMDVSFISQKLLFAAVCHILKPDGVFISLIKPQFEVGREKIGSGGIVRDSAAREAAVREVKNAAEKFGLTMLSSIPSPIAGGDGNEEYLAVFILKKG